MPVLLDEQSWYDVGSRIICVRDHDRDESCWVLKNQEIYTVEKVEFGWGRIFVRLEEVEGRYELSRFVKINQKKYRNIYDSFQISMDCDFEMKPSYQNNYVSNPDEALSHLLELDWLEMTEARLEYFMSDEPRSYVYGKGVHARTYYSNLFTDTVATIQNKLNTEFNCQYNVCFLNRYNTQKNQLGWHADDSPTMDKDHPIAVVSFGAEREIWWKIQNDKGQVPPEQRQKLEHGSLFVMPAGFQDGHFHRIPRADREVGVRVSLTFRRYITEGLNYLP